ncbi:MAG: hypothetical protein A4S09_17085 [Proteobacteria bacterium SG_bin7]|nr:MAG: hypothetical protein A4S09_17085 [Proteobacteria bacterium SG_bin7]
MEIQCECGEVKMELAQFPKNSPGRLVCYCDDCQVFLHSLGRSDLLDIAGGTEVVPVYPAEAKIISGTEFLRCTRLSSNGTYRWWSSCCKTPLGNTHPKRPWLGIMHRAYNVKDPKFLEKTFGPVRSRIRGDFARGTPPDGTSPQIGFKDFLVVFPFMLKGILLGKKKNSPFVREDGSPIMEPNVLHSDEVSGIRQELGFK